MATTSFDDLIELAGAYLELATAIGNYRIANWNRLTEDERKILNDDWWTLLTMSDDIAAKAAVIRLEMVQTDLENLKKCTAGMKDAAKRISEVKGFIAIATKAVALGGAFYAAAGTGNVIALAAASLQLLDLCSGQNG
jgi:hypothetical protein